MNTNDIVCKEYFYEEVIPFQLEFISRNEMDFFVPLSFQSISSSKVRICYNLAELNPLVHVRSRLDAAYLASKMIKGMREAMNMYIFPHEYLVKDKGIFVGRKDEIKIAFLPLPPRGTPLGDPGKEIRGKIRNLIKEVYEEGKDGKDSLFVETLSVLEDNTIGLDTVIRKIEKLREESYYRDPISRGASLDLYSNII